MACLAATWSPSARRRRAPRPWLGPGCVPSRRLGCPLATGLPEGEPRARGIDEDARRAHVAELAALDLRGRAELLRLRRSGLDVGDAHVREPLVDLLAAGDS